jgi:hypothetical protein
LPSVVWLLITSQHYARRAPISFAENFGWFSRSMLEWFLGTEATKQELNHYVGWLWIAILGLMAIAGALGHKWPQPRGTKPVRFHLIPLFLFGLTYIAMLFSAASLAYFNKLAGRFLLPAYIPLIVLPVVVAKLIRRGAAATVRPDRRWVANVLCYGALGLLAVALLRISLPLAGLSHLEGARGGDNAFNTRAWNGNPVVQYWKSHEPRGSYALLSNEPDGVAFQTGHAVEASPRKTTGPYGTQSYALGSYTNELFHPAMDTYLLWIEPNPYQYSYTPEDMRDIVQLEPIFVSEGGGLYLLKPK